MQATRAGVMIPASSPVIAFSWAVTEALRNDKGLISGSNCCKKLKHERSNTGLSASSSFPFSPFPHIRLVSALACRPRNGNLLEERLSVSRGQEVITDVTLKVTSGK